MSSYASAEILNPPEYFLFAFSSFNCFISLSLMCISRTLYGHGGVVIPRKESYAFVIKLKLSQLAMKKFSGINISPVTLVWYAVGDIS